MQALVSLNDPVFIEGARALAQRTLRELPTGNFEERLDHVFQLSLSRSPVPDEVARFRAFYDRRRRHFGQNIAAARALISVGSVPLDESIPASDLAAWTLVASTILNLDEAVTRE